MLKVDQSVKYRDIDLVWKLHAPNHRLLIPIMTLITTMTIITMMTVTKMTSPLVLLVLITFRFTPLYCNTSTTLTSSFRFYEVVRFVIINMDEHCYNHIKVVCTLHCQILSASQYNVKELF